jgi:hypothetical protein
VFKTIPITARDRYFYQLNVGKGVAIYDSSTGEVSPDPSIFRVGAIRTIIAIAIVATPMKLVAL